MANKMAEKKKSSSQSSARSQSQVSQVTAAKTRSTEQKPRQQTQQDTQLESKPVTSKTGAVARTERKEQMKRDTKPVQPARRDSKEPTFFSRLRNSRVGRFVFDAYYELRHKVTWPTVEEARNMTIAVLALSAAVGLILGGADYGLRQLFLLISGAR